MTINPEDINKIHELERCRTSLLRAMAVYQGHHLTIHEQDNDQQRISPMLPREMGIEVLGMLYGLVTAKLKALGVHFPWIEEGECFECDGTGTRRIRRR